MAKTPGPLKAPAFRRKVTTPLNFHMEASSSIEMRRLAGVNGATLLDAEVEGVHQMLRCYTSVPPARVRASLTSPSRSHNRAICYQ